MALSKWNYAPKPTGLSSFPYEMCFLGGIPHAQTNQKTYSRYMYIHSRVPCLLVYLFLYHMYVCVQMHAWMDGCMDVFMYVWMDGWMYVFICVCVKTASHMQF